MIENHKVIKIKSGKKIPTTSPKSSVRSFAALHPRLLSIAIYAGLAMAISSAMGFALYPEQQAFAKAFVFYPE